MHTKNTSLSGAPSHRLLVAFPLFAVIAVMSVYAGATMSRAQLVADGDISAGYEVQSIQTSAGYVQLDVSSTGTVEEGIFRMGVGTAMIASQEMLRVRADDWSIVGFDGAMHVSGSSGSYTFAALTTPLIVAQGSGVLVIPVGMQWATGTAQSDVIDLPSHFLKETLPAAEGLKTASKQTVDTAFGGIMFTPALMFDALQFESAEQRAMQYQMTSLLFALERALRDGDTAAYEALLLTDLMNDALSSEQGRLMLPRLLALSLEQGREAIMLPFFTQDQERWLLSVFHPSLRNYALALPVSADISNEYRVSALRVLPVSDTAADALEPLAAQAWQTMWEESLAALERPTDMLNESLSVMRDAMRRFEENRLPERLSRYRDMINAIVLPYELFLSQESQDILAEMQAIDVSVIAEIPDDSLPIVLPTESAEFNADEVQALTRARLADLGCMFTASTSVTAVSADRVEVRDIVFASARGDVLLTFVYHPESDAAGEIFYNGQILPYSLPLQNYLEWVRGL